MMRYFEWLFPIMKYVRLRQEVPAWRAVMAVVVVTLLPAMLFLLYLFSLPRWRVAGPLGLLSPIVNEWRTLAGIVIFTAVILSIINVLALIGALVFVRHQPGRRRPLCTWQTVKLVALSSRTWAILVGLAIATVVGGVHLAQGWVTAPGDAGLYFIVALLVVVLTGLLVCMGAVAVQAAQGVIVLQDDRRCLVCGYFLIGLTTPRCPECGTSFDPARLGELAATGNVYEHP